MGCWENSSDASSLPTATVRKLPLNSGSERDGRKSSGSCQPVVRSARTCHRTRASSTTAGSRFGWLGGAVPVQHCIGRPPVRRHHHVAQPGLGTRRLERAPTPLAAVRCLAVCRCGGVRIAGQVVNPAATVNAIAAGSGPRGGGRSARPTLSCRHRPCRVPHMCRCRRLLRATRPGAPHQPAVPPRT
jgi:hypothetical protein